MTHCHTETYIPPQLAEIYLKKFLELVPWEIWLLSPKSRMVYSWDGESTTEYGKIISEIVHRLQSDTGKVCQGVFMNRYLNGDDYCPYHKDMYNCDVFTLSLGQTRDILLKPDKGKKMTQSSIH